MEGTGDRPQHVHQPGHQHDPQQEPQTARQQGLLTVRQLGLQIGHPAGYQRGRQVLQPVNHPRVIIPDHLPRRVHMAVEVEAVEVIAAEVVAAVVEDLVVAAVVAAAVEAVAAEEGRRLHFKITNYPICKVNLNKRDCFFREAVSLIESGARKIDFKMTKD